MNFKNSKTLGEWDQWKRTLGKAVDLGQSMGVSENTVDRIAYRVGNVLTATVDPENREQRVLQELWKAGDDEDRRVLAKMIVKMVETDEK